MRNRTEVLVMGVPLEVRLSKGARQIIEEARAVGINPSGCLEEAVKTSIINSDRGQHYPLKIGHFGAGELPFSGLKASIDSRRTLIAQVAATSRRGR